MKKFSQIFESDESMATFGEIKEEINEMIETTVNNIGGDVVTFIESMKKTPEDFKIEGLINDSDIYAFYLKWRNDIDELLNNMNFYDEVPSENNIYSLYGYIIKGTEKAVIELVGEL
jgi:hypothetical protein